MSEVTALINAAKAGDKQAESQLFRLVYDDLRQLAAWQLAQENPGQTLQASGLVNEVYLRLFGPRQDGGKRDELVLEGRGHFFAAAAEAMRRILIENARRKKRLKRGGDRRRVDLEQVEAAGSAPGEDLLDLDEALQRLADEDPGKAELVKLRFYAGLSIEEAASCLNISRATAARHWAYARAWLYAHLERGHDAAKS